MNEQPPFCNDCGEEYEAPAEAERLIVCARIESAEVVAGKKPPLTKLKVDVGAGAEDEVTLTVVSNAKHLEVGRIIVVAKEGATVGDVVVKKATVGGVPSFGVVCDSTALNWSGGGAGNAVFLPDDQFKPGDAPPSEKPRPGGKK